MGFGFGSGLEGMLAHVAPAALLTAEALRGLLVEQPGDHVARVLGEGGREAQLAFQDEAVDLHRVVRAKGRVAHLDREMQGDVGRYKEM